MYIEVKIPKEIRNFYKVVPNIKNTINLTPVLNQLLGCKKIFAL